MQVDTATQLERATDAFSVVGFSITDRVTGNESLSDLSVDSRWSSASESIHERFYYPYNKIRKYTIDCSGWIESIS